MVYEVVLTAKARADLRAIGNFIACDDAAVAQRFIRKLLDDAQSLGRAPRRGCFVHQRPGVRRIVRHPYLIYYRIEEDACNVRILRFWHGSREPKSLRLEE